MNHLIKSYPRGYWDAKQETWVVAEKATVYPDLSAAQKVADRLGSNATPIREQGVAALASRSWASK